MDKLIGKLEDYCHPDNFKDGAHYIKVVDVIALIREAFEGKGAAAKTLLSQLEGHTLVPTKALSDLIEAHKMSDVHWGAMREIEVLLSQGGKG